MRKSVQLISWGDFSDAAADKLVNRAHEDFIKTKRGSVSDPVVKHTCLAPSSRRKVSSVLEAASGVGAVCVSCKTSHCLEKIRNPQAGVVVNPL